MKQGDGLLMIMEKDTNEAKYYSKRLMCPTTGMAYGDPAPNKFSFNSPEGACPHCKGLGYVNEIDLNKVIPDNSLSIGKGNPSFRQIQETADFLADRNNIGKLWLHH